MALANYTDLTAAVASWMTRSDLTSQIPDFVTLFEAGFNQNPDNRFRQMETTTSLSPSSGSVALPSDFLEVRRLRWDGSAARDLEFMTPTAMTTTWPTSPSGTPAVYTIVGSNILVMPTSDTALTLDYYQKLSSLQTNETNWLMTAYPNIYLAGTLHEAYAFIQDAEKALLWKAKADDGLDKLRRASAFDTGNLRMRVMVPTP